MSRMIKQIVTGALIGVLLAACAAPRAVEAPKPAEPAGQPAELPPVTITYTYGGTVFKDVDMVSEALSAIAQKKINATIKLKPIDWGAYDEKMKLAFAAGEECDIVFTAPWINNYIQNIANGNIIPLDDLLPKYAPGLWKSMPESSWDAARVGGKIYGVLNQQIWVKPFGFLVRKDLADKYGLDVNTIQKYEDLEPFLKAVQEGEPDVIPLTSAYNWMFETAGFDPIVSQQVPAAIRYDDKDLKVLNVVATPEFKASVELARKWYLAGYAPKDKIEPADGEAMWRAGKFAMQLAVVIKPGGDIESRQRSGQEVYQKSVTQPFLTTAAASATMNAICRTSKNPERAMMVLELLNTDVEFYNLISKGIEGRHWEWADKENKVIKPGPNNADYNPNTDWEFGNQFNAYYIDPEQAAQKVWEATYKLNNESPPSAALGFNFNPDPVKTELANVAAVVKEFGEPLTNGMVDPATALPEYLKRLDEAGLQTIIAETQKQLNEWAQSKK
ncbi:MAG: ABC transporter substrate-binding protein [Anaerolineae bacterium]|nr:ABC transporter substrate-binding protein [Thermoflexales bacterium]MDW8406388.1 ABC transporter substrate-binding protein [Anaerolineae bacterium]